MQMRKLATALAAITLAGAAHANTISQEYSLATDSVQLHYFNFTVTTAGSFALNVFGFSTLGAGYDSDTMLQLFQNSLTVANHLGGDDDSGIGTDALLNINLNPGNYILAVGDYSFSAVDAVNGQGGYVEAPGGLIRVQVGSQNGVAQITGSQIPEPGTLALLGLAGLAAGVARRRKH